MQWQGRMADLAQDVAAQLETFDRVELHNASNCSPSCERLRSSGRHGTLSRIPDNGVVAGCLLYVLEDFSECLEIPPSQRYELLPPCCRRGRTVTSGFTSEQWADAWPAPRRPDLREDVRRHLVTKPSGRTSGCFKAGYPELCEGGNVRRIGIVAQGRRPRAAGSCLRGSAAGSSRVRRTSPGRRPGPGDRHRVDLAGRGRAPCWPARGSMIKRCMPSRRAAGPSRGKCRTLSFDFRERDELLHIPPED